MHLGPDHTINDIDRMLDRYRQRPGYKRESLDVSVFSKVYDVVANSLKVIPTLACLAGSTALVTSATKTFTDACLDTILDRNIYSFANGFTKTAFISNAKFGIWGLLFSLAFLNIKSYIHYNKLPSLNKNPIEAIEVGYYMGKLTGMGSSAIFGRARNKIIANIFDRNIASKIFTAIGLYGYFRLMKSLIYNE